jgi:hypothetical protein
MIYLLLKIVLLAELEVHRVFAPYSSTACESEPLEDLDNLSWHRGESIKLATWYQLVLLTINPRLAVSVLLGV